MKNKFTPFIAPLAVFALCSLASHLQAQIIAVPNHDLQVDSTKYTTGNAVIDTTQDSTVIQYFTETHTGDDGGYGHYGSAGVGAPDGTSAGFVNTDNNGTVTLSSDLTAGGTQAAPTFISGQLYTFTLSIGINPTNQNTDYDRIGNISFGLTSNGVTVGTQTLVPSGTIIPTLDGNGSPQVTFEDFTFSYLATAGDAGNAIGLQINDQFPGGSQTEFSNIRLSAEAVPEPGTWAMFLAGLGLLAFSIRFRGLVRL